MSNTLNRYVPKFIHMSELFEYDKELSKTGTQPLENPRRKSRRTRRRRVEPQGEEKELDYYVDKAMSGEDFSDIPNNKLNPLLCALTDKRNDLLNEGLINDAEKADSAIHKTKELMMKNMKTDAMSAKKSEIMERLNAAKEELNNLQQTIERQEKNMRIQMQKQRIELEAKHHEEMEELTRKWESPDQERRYNRSSQQLRQLRTQAVMMLNSRRYDEMKVVERIADRLQEDEAYQQHQHMEDDFNVVLKKLIGKHQLEKEKLQRAQNVKIGEYEAAKNFDLDVARKRIQNLERELADASDSDKVWVRYHRNEYIRPQKLRGVSRRSINPQEFTSLNLPPLDEPKSSRLPPAAKLVVQTYRQSPRSPRGVYR